MGGVRRMGACGTNGILYTNDLEHGSDNNVDDDDDKNKGGTVAMVVDENEKKNSTEVCKDDKMNLDNEKKDSDAMDVDVVSLPKKDNKIEGIKNDSNTTVTNNTVVPIVPSSTTTTATSKVLSSTTAASASLDGKNINTNTTTTTTTSTTTNTNTNIKLKGVLSIPTDNVNNGVTIDPIRRYEIQRCKEAMLEALGTFLLDEESNGSATAAGGISIGGMGMDDTTTSGGGGCGDNTQNGNGGGNGNGNGGRHNSFGRGLKGWNDLEDVFGESLVPFVRPRSYGRHADYLSCFL